MAKRIRVVGAKPKKVAVVDQPKRRIDPTEFAVALGAQPGGVQVRSNLGPVALADLAMLLPTAWRVGSNADSR